MEALIATLIESWNAGDAELFGSLFSESADYDTGRGSRVQGRAAIADLLASSETGKVVLKEGPSIRYHGSAARVVFSWNSESGARRGIVRLVATRCGDAWHIDRLQTTDEA